MHHVDSSLFPSGQPYLEHFPEPGGPVHRVSITHSPFTLGRDAKADLVLYSQRVSKAHAIITQEDDQFYVQDLGSTNGTFINGRRVKDSLLLTDGDIIHIAHKEFRFGIDVETIGEQDSIATESGMLHAPRSLIQGGAHLRELLARRQAVAFFQPIWLLQDQSVLGYEALGRGRHHLLPTSPGPLFALAQQCKLASELSCLFRDAAVSAAAALPPASCLFLNTHPEELSRARIDDLLQALPDLLEALPPWTPPLATESSPAWQGTRLVLEVHEDYVADTATMKRLRSQLHALDIRLAYDDFGVGQARLSALTEAPPDFVKLDMTIVQGLTSSRALQDLVRTLARVCDDLGCELIAEGVEKEEEASLCHELGCRLAQGYLFSRPKPIEDLALTFLAARDAK